MKSFFSAVLVIMTIASAASAQRWGGGGRPGGPGAGVRYADGNKWSPADCGRDRMISCDRLSRNRNEGCTPRGNRCEAWEGNGNGGNPACRATCEITRAPRYVDGDKWTPADCGRQTMVRCERISRNRNEGCTPRGNRCEAWEGNGNGGNPACRATCN